MTFEEWIAAFGVLDPSDHAEEITDQPKMLLHPPQPYKPKKDDRMLFLEKVDLEFDKIIEVVKANPNVEYVYAKFKNDPLGEETRTEEYKIARQIQHVFRTSIRKNLYWNNRVNDGVEYCTVMYDPGTVWGLFWKDIKSVFTK